MRSVYLQAKRCGRVGHRSVRPRVVRQIRQRLSPSLCLSIYQRPLRYQSRTFMQEFQTDSEVNNYQQVFDLKVSDLTNIVSTTEAHPTQANCVVPPRNNFGTSHCTPHEPIVFTTMPCTMNGSRVSLHSSVSSPPSPSPSSPKQHFYYEFIFMILFCFSIANCCHKEFFLQVIDGVLNLQLSHLRDKHYRFLLFFTSRALSKVRYLHRFSTRRKLLLVNCLTIPILLITTLIICSKVYFTLLNMQ